MEVYRSIRGSEEVSMYQVKRKGLHTWSAIDDFIMDSEPETLAVFRDNEEAYKALAEAEKKDRCEVASGSAMKLLEVDMYMLEIGEAEPDEDSFQGLGYDWKKEPAADWYAAWYADTHCTDEDEEDED